MCVGCSGGHDGSIVQDQLSLAYIHTQQYGMCVGIVNVIIIYVQVYIIKTTMIILIRNILMIIGKHFLVFFFFLTGQMKCYNTIDFDVS